MVIRKQQLEDDEMLTQYGNLTDLTDGRVFRIKPRPRREADVSVLIGKQSPYEAADLIRGGVRDPSDRVRRTLVGTLRAAGFEVTHAPSPRIPDHAVVRHAGAWTEQVAQAFDACFGEPEAEGGGETA